MARVQRDQAPQGPERRQVDELRLACGRASVTRLACVSKEKGDRKDDVGEVNGRYSCR